MLNRLAGRAGFWFSAVDLQLERKFHFVAKPALAGLLAILLLCFSTLAASPTLHQLIHSDSAPDSQSCVVCLLAQGQANSVAIISIAAVFVFALLLLVEVARAAAFLQFDYRFAPSRGPPSVSSSHAW
ncbi:hypothetical protein [Pedosphaera parvula]|uniref:hypothetical protein n=1 Tax=Pedosphaera parvula TaxID=1032527 RepID=UPI00058F9540|nr:hypothetical protein [Pedosphaera parvula]